jgi:hypothetical protein
MQIVLTPMGPGRGAEFDAMLEEFRAAGETHVYQGDFAVAWQGYSAFYELLSRMKAGGYPTPDIVPMDSYFIERGGRVLGGGVRVEDSQSGYGISRRYWVPTGLRVNSAKAAQP